MSKKPRRPGIALLGIADTYIDAMMWKDMLEQESIPCMVRDGSATIGELQAALPGPGHMEVYVPASALARSRAIIGITVFPSERVVPSGSPSFSWMWLLLILGPALVAGIIAAVAFL